MMKTNYSTGFDLELEIEAAYLANAMLDVNIMTTNDPAITEMVHSLTLEQLQTAGEIYSAIDVQLNPNDIVHWMAGNVFHYCFRRLLLSSDAMLDVAYLAHAMHLNDQPIEENLALADMIRNASQDTFREAAWVHCTTGVPSYEEHVAIFNYDVYTDYVTQSLNLKYVA